jgi:hypothetical protein
MSEPTFQQLLLTNPLTEETRKERRNLLAVSALGIVMMKTGLIPAKISALGIEFSHTDQTSLLRIVAAITGYFLTAFIVYALSDFWIYRIVTYLAQSTSNLDALDSLTNTYLRNFKAIQERVREAAADVEFLNEKKVQLMDYAKLQAEIAEKEAEGFKEAMHQFSLAYTESRKKELISKNNELVAELWKKLSEITSQSQEMKTIADGLKNEFVVTKAKAEARLEQTTFSIKPVKAIAVLRVVFEFIIPCAIGLYAMVELLSQR